MIKRGPYRKGGRQLGKEGKEIKGEKDGGRKRFGIHKGIG